MSETVVITTDDLEPAVRLRGEFEKAGLQVELLTAGESLADARGEPVLLVLTGTEPSTRWESACHEIGAPAFNNALSRFNWRSVPPSAIDMIPPVRKSNTTRDTVESI